MILSNVALVEFGADGIFQDMLDPLNQMEILEILGQKDLLLFQIDLDRNLAGPERDRVAQLQILE